MMGVKNHENLPMSKEGEQCSTAVKKQFWVRSDASVPSIVVIKYQGQGGGSKTYIES